MKCADCGTEGHKAGWTWCPGGKRTAVVKGETLKTKKPWVKPTLTRWVKADSLTESNILSNKVLTGEDVRQPESNKKFDKKTYQREYMRRVRGMDEMIGLLEEAGKRLNARALPSDVQVWDGVEIHKMRRDVKGGYWEVEDGN